MDTKPSEAEHGLKIIIVRLVCVCAALVLSAWLTSRYLKIQLETTSSRRAVEIRAVLGRAIFYIPVIGPTSLTDVIYPGSLPVDQLEASFFDGPPGHETKDGQLVVLAFRVHVQSIALVDWYRHKLGPAFRMCSAWPCERGIRDHDWPSMIPIAVGAQVGAFQQEFEDRVRGVLLAPATDGVSETVVTMYDFQSRKSVGQP